MMKTNSYKNLKQYLKLDVSYQNYLKGKDDFSDFDMFCINHCLDIQELIEDNGNNEDLVMEYTIRLNAIKQYCINILAIEPDNSVAKYILDEIINFGKSD